MKRKICRLFGFLTAFCLIYILLITAVEAVCYWMPGYFESEYEKHDVLSALPEMTMSEEDGLMAVTYHMMKYLRGDEDTPDLQITVRMGGAERGFFTEREILHMEDVRELFVGAQRLRLAAAAGAFLLFFGFLLIRKRAIQAGKPADGVYRRAYAQGILIGTAAFLLLCIVFGGIIASDFSSAFITFHHIFFTNDLWLLDPSVDMLVNIVPEGFFFDTAARILVVFALSLVILCAAAVLLSREKKR